MIYFRNVTNVLFIFLPTIHYEKFYWKVWDKYFFSRLPIVFEAISYTLANWAIIRGKAGIPNVASYDDIVHFGKLEKGLCICRARLLQVDNFFNNSK